MRLQNNIGNRLYSDLHFDFLEVEREARALRAQAVADAFRAARVWVSARLRRPTDGQAA